MKNHNLLFAFLLALPLFIVADAPMDAIEEVEDVSADVAEVIEEEEEVVGIGKRNTSINSNDSIDSGSNRDAFSFDSDNGLRLYFNGSATGYADLSTNRVLRDTSAFYHLVIAVDTTQATAAASSKAVQQHVNAS